jgi:hypothetical protein
MVSIKVTPVPRRTLPYSAKGLTRRDQRLFITRDIRTYRLSGLLLSLDLDDEIDLVADRTQQGFHAEIGTVQNTTR